MRLRQVQQIRCVVVHLEAATDVPRERAWRHCHLLRSDLDFEIPQTFYADRVSR